MIIMRIKCALSALILWIFSHSIEALVYILKAHFVSSFHQILCPLSTSHEYFIDHVIIHHVRKQFCQGLLNCFKLQNDT